MEKKKKKPLAERIKEKEEAKRQKKKELEEVCNSYDSFCLVYLISLYMVPRCQHSVSLPLSNAVNDLHLN